MAPGLSALDVLNLVLVVALVAASAGWAGGRGGLRSAFARIRALEDVQETYDIRLKRREGAVGQAATQKRKTLLQERDAEAEQLARDLAARRGRGGGMLFPAELTEQEREEGAAAQLEAEAEALGLKQKGKAG